MGIVTRTSRGSRSEFSFDRSSKLKADGVGETSIESKTSSTSTRFRYPRCVLPGFPAGNPSTIVLKWHSHHVVHTVHERDSDKPGQDK